MDDRSWRPKSLTSANFFRQAIRIVVSHINGDSKVIVHCLVEWNTREGTQRKIITEQ